MIMDAEISPEEMEAMREAEAERQAQLAARYESLALELAKSRAEAIRGRQESGIENEWLIDEEYYEGIDDANRGEMMAWRTKPMGQAYLESSDKTGSTVFINITQQYCDAVAARIGDMLMPTDDAAFSIKPTPVPELQPIAEGNLSKAIQKQILAQSQNQQEAEAKQAEIIEMAKGRIDVATEKAEKAQTRVEDWHVECQYHSEVRKVIEDCAKIGSGVLKGPVPQKRRHIAYIDGQLVVEEQIKPVSLRIDPWNLYPDPGCGQNIHSGSYIWERDDITRKQLSELKGSPGYLDDQIDRVLKEGPHKATKEVTDRMGVDGLTKRETNNLFEIWYGHLQLSPEDMVAAGYEFDEDQPPVVNAQVTMVNNVLIRATMNPLDTGDFPYDVMVIKQRFGMPWGIGISRQVRTPQRIVNGAARNMMDNAGIAGGPMMIYKAGIIEPENGVLEIAPRKLWRAAEDADMDHLDNAIRFIKMDMMQVELQAIIFMGMKLAEDVVGLPMIMQGQMGQATPDRVGVVEILNNNASTVLRRIARLFDDLLTEPHIRRYYAYLMQYGEDEEKGEFVIDARGSSALVERAIEGQEIAAMVNMASNPVFGIDPKKWMAEHLKSKRLDPKRFEFDDEDWENTVKNLAQPQQNDPRLEIATLNAQAKERLEQQRQQFEASQNQIDWQYEMAIKQIDEQIEMMGQENTREISFDRMKETFNKIKADMANNVLRLRTQKELAGMNGRAPQVATPAIEPAGRAQNGMAFQQ